MVGEFLTIAIVGIFVVDYLWLFSNRLYLDASKGEDPAQKEVGLPIFES